MRLLYDLKMALHKIYIGLEYMLLTLWKISLVPFSVKELEIKTELEKIPSPQRFVLRR